MIVVGSGRPPQSDAASRFLSRTAASPARPTGWKPARTPSSRRNGVPRGICRRIACSARTSIAKTNISCSYEGKAASGVIRSGRSPCTMPARTRVTDRSLWGPRESRDFTIRPVFDTGASYLPQARESLVRGPKRQLHSEPVAPMESAALRALTRPELVDLIALQPDRIAARLLRLPVHASHVDLDPVASGGQFLVVIAGSIACRAGELRQLDMLFLSEQTSRRFNCRRRAARRAEIVLLQLPLKAQAYANHGSSHAPNTERGQAMTATIVRNCRTKPTTGEARHEQENVDTRNVFCIRRRHRGLRLRAGQLSVEAGEDRHRIRTR